MYNKGSTAVSYLFAVWSDAHTRTTRKAHFSPKFLLRLRAATLSFIGLLFFPAWEQTSKWTTGLLVAWLIFQGLNTAVLPTSFQKSAQPYSSLSSLLPQQHFVLGWSPTAGTSANVVLRVLPFTKSLFYIAFSLKSPRSHFRSELSVFSSETRDERLSEVSKELSDP